MGIIDDKWELIFEKYKIKRDVERNGLFYITAESIREFKRIDKQNFFVWMKVKKLFSFH